MGGSREGLSIRARLILANALLLGAVAASPLLFLPSRLEAQARQDLERRAIGIARSFAAASEAALDFDDRPRAREILRGLGSAGGVVYGVLLRSDGRTLAAWGSPPSGAGIEPGAEPCVKYGPSGLLVQVPIATPSGARGALELGLDLGELQRRRKESRALVAWTATAVFAVGLLALVLIATFLTQPVRALTRLARRVEVGDEEAARLAARRQQGEVGQVASAFEVVIDRLSTQRAMLQSQSEATVEGILTLDNQGAVITHNRRLCQLWSLRDEDVAGSSWRDIRPLLEATLVAPLPEWLQTAAPTLPRGTPESFDLSLVGDRSLTVHVATVRRPEGTALGLGLYFRDITRRVQDRRRIEELAQTLERRVEERTRELAAASEELGRRLEELRRTQEQLVIADRRVSLGRLAAGVAHEINNPLTYLLGNLRCVREDLASIRERGAIEGRGETTASKLDEVLAALGDAAAGGERVARIVQGLRSFSRGDEDRREPVSLARAMDAALEIAGHEVRHRARLVKRMEVTPPVMANEVRLSQVFLNLLVNAAQAIGPGAADRQEVTVAVGTEANGWAFAEVRDTGCGIDPEVRSRIFDPFFTTKAQGEGTGLGLSISLGIVTSFGGCIEVESEPGRGSAFRVKLPPATEEPRQRTPVPSAVPLPRACKILVVDDELLVAKSLKRLLASDRHEVTVAQSGSEAIELARKGSRYDLVLCDLMMPGATGVDVYQEFVKTAPELARSLFFMSGGAFTEATAAFVEEHRDRFLTKPVDLDRLRRVIHAHVPS